MLASWMENTMKNAANHAPTVLLIHANRVWKLNGQAAFMDTIANAGGITLVDMDTYGDYGRERENFFYESALSNNTLTIVIPDSQLPLDEKLSIVVDDGNRCPASLSEQQVASSFPTGWSLGTATVWWFHSQTPKEILTATGTPILMISFFVFRYWRGFPRRV